jgi:hypothetical protein
MNWNNLTAEERAEYMRLQMSKQSYGRSAYLPDDCSECGACGQPTMGYGWCSGCLARYAQLRKKLMGGLNANS